MPVSAARSAAFDLLLRIETTEAYATELLHSARAAALSLRDHGLATEIAMGVLRWRCALDERIAVHLGKPFRKLDVEVITALRMGAYQLLFLDRIPRHAAINESVELVKKARKRSAAGLVNAVLRKINLPVASSPIAAHPDWILKRWTASYGPKAVQQICEYDQRTPDTVLRADPSLVQELEIQGIALQPGKLLSKTYVVTSGDITRTRAFREKRLVIQDEASQLVALLLAPGERILDCCAAPGGKTRILAERSPAAIVVAMELHPHRAALMRRLVPTPNVHILAADARTIPFESTFDRIIADVPCTGTGTLARNPEIKWRLRPEDIDRMQSYQLEILTAAMRQVAKGGQLVYSSCSLEPEENEGVIEQVLQASSCFRLRDMRDQLTQLGKEGALVCSPDSLVQGPYLRTIPGVHPSDGFFAALLEREM
jgi:16S rRNA (cytosine967-C5)-methyltransferase